MASKKIVWKLTPSLRKRFGGKALDTNYKYFMVVGNSIQQKLKLFTKKPKQ